MDETRATERPGTSGSSRVRVGVLSFHNSKETKAILNAVGDLGHDPVWLREENARTWMAGSSLRFDPDVDVVANRLLATKSSRPLEDLGVASTYASVRPVLNPPESVMQAMHKYGATATLAAAGLPVPDAYMAFDHGTVNADDRPFDGRAVHKPAVGTNGNRMTLVDTADPVSPQVARRRAFLQEYLEPGDDRPSDVRIYVVGGQVIGAMKRFAPAEEWRTNVALGGEVEDVTGQLSADATHLATRATDVLDLDYAGVDLLSSDGRWHLLEVNATAGFKGLFDATGTSPAPHIASLAIERAGGRVDEDAVEELATTLDDSIPACKPSIEVIPDAPETIGYTERIAVGGDRRIHRTVAKSDTGAKRTSIDIDVAATVGAGPVVDTTRVKSGAQNASQRRPLVDLDVKLANRWYTTTASIEDRSHMNYPVLLGRDVLQGFHVDINQRVGEE